MLLFLRRNKLILILLLVLLSCITKNFDKNLSFSQIKKTSLEVKQGRLKIDLFHEYTKNLSKNDRHKLKDIKFVLQAQSAEKAKDYKLAQKFWLLASLSAGKEFEKHTFDHWVKALRKEKVITKRELRNLSKKPGGRGTSMWSRFLEAGTGEDK